MIGINDIVKDYLTNNLKIVVRTNRAGYGSYDNAKAVTVSLELEGEEISSTTFEVTEAEGKGYY